MTEDAAADLASKSLEQASEKYAALADVENWQGHGAEALATVGKALAGSPSTQLQMRAATVLIDNGDLARAQKLAATLSAQSSAEPQAYGKIVAGMIALKRKDTKEAVKQITAANKLLDTWIGRFELGRSYLEAGAFSDAAGQFDECLKRRGEAIELFVSDVPTYSYLPVVYYDQGRARDGMKSANSADSYKTYLAIRGQSTEDPLVAEVRRRLGQ